ncbi:hypothetical protein [uncultured Sphingomonas sp.]|uniref:hypothetical protein n=1 Tax=uncultured Sphingomonas sp. TaxID=158754 RepID=UPI0030D8A65C
MARGRLGRAGRAPRRPDRSRSIARAVGGVLVVMVAGAVIALTGEGRIAAADARAQRAQAPAAAAAPPSILHPPRAIFAEALATARAALRERDAQERRALLDDADRRATMAAAARPAWGEAWALAAWVRGLRDGSDSAAARDALSASYRATPFLRHAGAWRIGRAFATFDLIDTQVRARAVREAVWLMRIDPELVAPVMASARGSSAYRPVLLEWRRDRAAP